MAICRTCYGDGRKNCPRCRDLGIEIGDFETREIVFLLLEKIRKQEQRIDDLYKKLETRRIIYDHSL